MLDWKGLTKKLLQLRKVFSSLLLIIPHFAGASEAAPVRRYDIALEFRYHGPLVTGHTSPVNEIPKADFVMAPFVVKERPFKIDYIDTLTPKGKLAYAKNTYLSPVYRKTVGPLAQLAAYYFAPLSILGGWHPNDYEAMTLLEQDIKLKRVQSMDDLFRLEMAGRSKESAELLKLKSLRHDNLSRMRNDY